MTLITVYYPNKNDVEREKVENNLFWYDTVLKRMRTFKGGFLKFEYIEDEELKELGYKNCYRMKPKVVELEKSIKKQNKDKNSLKKFFNEYLNYNSRNIFLVSEDDKGINFEVPEDEVNYFIGELYRRRFDYEKN